MTVREYLRNVHRTFADNHHRWTQGAMCRGRGKGVCYCFVGAMRREAGGSANLEVTGGAKRVYRAALVRIAHMLHPDMSKAFLAQHSTNQLEYFVIQWNDNKTRTIGDILTVSRKASRI